MTTAIKGVRGGQTHRFVTEERVFEAGERSEAKLEIRAVKPEDNLPDGCCGVLSGICLVYNETDSYGTRFAPGCLAKTITEKVDKRKVKLFADHAPFTDAHVGTIMSITDIGGAAVMTAAIFDTEAGRRMKDYVGKVLDSGSQTGLSVGFKPRSREWIKDAGDDEGGYVLFREIELNHIGVTPINAVPGADVTGVRKDEDGGVDVGLLKRSLRAILNSLPEGEARAEYEAVYASSAAPVDKANETPASPVIDADAAASAERSATEGAGKGKPVTMDDRLAVVRRAIGTGEPIAIPE